MLGVRDIAEALLANGQQDQPFVGEFGGDRCADRTLSDCLGMSGVAEQEGNVKHTECGNGRADHPAGNDRHVDRAALGRGNDGVLAAECAGPAVIDDDALAVQFQQFPTKLVGAELLRTLRL